MKAIEINAALAPVPGAYGTNAVISLSGGLDSTCLLMHLLASGVKHVRAFSFDYGQKHSIELKKVKKNIKFLQSKGIDVTHQVINLRDCFSDSASSLHEGGIDIPHGHYAAENMKSTVVENRNVIFSSIVYGKALGWANHIQDNVMITLGLHAGDHCLPGDTKVWTPNGKVDISHLKVGNTVMAYDHDTGLIVGDVVTYIKEGENSEIYTITAGGTTLKATGEHKVYIYDGGDALVKTKVQDLKVGSLMARTHHTEQQGWVTEKVRVDNITREELAAPIKVYDITVRDHHNYFAGSGHGVLVSNSIYPDCRPESQEMAKELFRISNWGSERISYIAPFVNIDKSNVLISGIEGMLALGFTQAEIRKILKNTHTCYDPDEKGRSCGACGSCRERISSFRTARTTYPWLTRDPVAYQVEVDWSPIDHME